MLKALRTLSSSKKDATIGLQGKESRKASWNAAEGRSIADPKLLKEVTPASKKELERFIQRNILKTKGTITLPVKIKL